jgi:hypothetical protein
VKAWRVPESVAPTLVDDPGRALENLLASQAFGHKKDAVARQGKPLHEMTYLADVASIHDHELPPRLTVEKAEDGRRLIRLGSGTPEFASLSETFHWSIWSRGAARVPEVSTSTAYRRSFNALTSGVKIGDSSGSPPVTTTRRQGNIASSSRSSSREGGWHAGRDAFPLDGEEALGETSCYRGHCSRSQ